MKKQPIEQRLDEAIKNFEKMQLSGCVKNLGYVRLTGSTCVHPAGLVYFD